MKIYYYHTRPIQQAMDEWKEFKHPGHILYGLPLFEHHGIECIYHPYRNINNRLWLILYTTIKVIFCKEKYEAIYATSFLGLEFIILLRSLGLFRKPIIIWHHTAVNNSKNKTREFISRIFYKGIDKMFFFSQKLINDSISSGKVCPTQLKLIHWGPDLSFYDHIISLIHSSDKHGFISTGKENRDIDTLMKACCDTSCELDVYISESCGNISYKNIIEQYDLPDSIHIHYTKGIIPYELAKVVAQKACIVIPCLKFAYTVGLTTLVEAMALGVPVISTRNPYFEIDIDKEHIGISVEYGDVKGWEEAINYISTHAEEATKMGENARKLAEKRFNMDIFAREIAETILTYHSDSNRPNKTK